LDSNIIKKPECGIYHYLLKKHSPLAVNIFKISIDIEIDTSKYLGTGDFFEEGHEFSSADLVFVTVMSVSKFRAVFYFPPYFKTMYYACSLLRRLLISTLYFFGLLATK